MNDLIPSIPTPLPTQSIPVQRIVGRNPGLMTGPGTNSYLIGQEVLCLIDPGPEDATQLQAFLDAIGARELRYILVTHTHRDHSPGASALQEVTGARLVGLPAPEVSGHDRSFLPAQAWLHGDVLECDEYSVRLIHTPGHVSNHICYELVQESLLFTGDHVLEGTTSVILPPDGDMGDYLDSLAALQKLPLTALAPGHGRLIGSPQEEIARLIAHRLRREAKILDGLERLGDCSEDHLVQLVYDDVDPSLIPWALKTQQAHLIKLQRDGRAVQVAGRWRKV